MILKILMWYGLVSAAIVLFTLLGVTIKRNFRFGWAWARWEIRLLLLTPLQLLAIFFPLAWITRNIPILKWLFWITMDDSRFDKNNPDGYAKDYSIYIRDRGITKENFKVAAEWHMGRNRIYNLVHLLGSSIPKPPTEVGNNNIVSLAIPIDNLYMLKPLENAVLPMDINKDKSYTRTHIQQDGIWVNMASMKYVGRPEDDPWQVNSGDIINFNTTILGEGLMYYKPAETDWVTFRYSHCKQVNYLLWKGWRIMAIGTNNERYVITIKHKRFKPWSVPQ